MVAIANNVYANLLEGQPHGIVIEAIDRILPRMGRRPRYIVMPGSADVAIAVSEGTIGVNSVIVMSTSNQSQYRFTAPIVTEFNIVAVRQDYPLKMERLSDLYGLKLGGRTGYQYPLLENDPNINLQRFAQDGELIRNLIHKRIDAAIISAISDVYKLRAEGVMAQIRLLAKAVGEVPLRVGLSPILFTQDDQARFDALLSELKASAEWVDILQHNGFADLVVDWPIAER
jgi:ABC-type amino acid transport substrate-binding protein